jgi:hypothetical protein
MARKTASSSAVHDAAEWASRDEPPPLEVGAEMIGSWLEDLRASVPAREAS